MMVLKELTTGNPKSFTHSLASFLIRLNYFFHHFLARPHCPTQKCNKIKRNFHLDYCCFHFAQTRNTHKIGLVKCEERKNHDQADSF